jgi:hypothetical protein
MVANFTVMAFASAVDKRRMPDLETARGKELRPVVETIPKLSKPIQTNPRKMEGNPRQKSLDSLGFLRPIRDFSMGYSDSKQKTRPPSRVQLSRASCRTLSRSPQGALPRLGEGSRSAGSENRRPLHAVALHPSPPCIIRSAHWPKVPRLLILEKDLLGFGFDRRRGRSRLRTGPRTTLTDHGAM